METRLAALDDASLLAALHAESFGDAKWTADQFAESLELDTTIAWIVEENHSPQGFILCQIAGEEAEILTLCIRPSARRHGLGLRLLQALDYASREKNARFIFLEVAVDNRAALTLYEKVGYRISGRRARYYKRDGKLVDAIMYRFDL
jgi:ribosomal-protein-alanine N-acetyltransferase